MRENGPIHSRDVLAVVYGQSHSLLILSTVQIKEYMGKKWLTGETVGQDQGRGDYYREPASYAIDFSTIRLLSVVGSGSDITVIDLLENLEVYGRAIPEEYDVD